MAKLAQIKTKATTSSVDSFIDTIADEQKRKDCYAIIKMIEKATKEKAKMWGSAIIGFGDKRYISPKTGREVEWFKIGFSPRKANFSLYMMDIKRQEEALKKLGKYKVGGGCLYINKLSDIDIKILEKMIAAALK